MAEPDRQKMMMRLSNLNVTLESLYRQAWQDGYEAGASGWEKHRCWNCTNYNGNGLCTKLWEHVDGDIDSIDHCAHWHPADSTKRIGRSGANWIPFDGGSKDSDAFDEDVKTKWNKAHGKNYFVRKECEVKHYD